MSTPNDGGPAFPNRVDTVEDGDIVPMEAMGMSLRDYFAGQALNGLVSDPNNRGKFETYASDAYSFADAMLKAREAKP